MVAQPSVANVPILGREKLAWALTAVGLPHVSVLSLYLVRYLFIASGTALLLVIDRGSSSAVPVLLFVAAGAAALNTAFVVWSLRLVARPPLRAAGTLDAVVMVFSMAWIGAHSGGFGPMSAEIVEIALIIGVVSALIHLGVLQGGVVGAGLMGTFAWSYFVLQHAPDGVIAGLLGLAMGGVLLTLLVPLITGIRFEHQRAEEEILIAEQRTREVSALNRLIREICR